ncbi:MAG: ribosome biogenesis factor YjgA [Granulosicoccaceae bacterium]
MSNQDFPDDLPDDDEIEYVSRGELKREMQALQTLGRDLTAVSGKVLADWDITPRTLEAILEGKRLVPRALNRHLRFVAKLLADEDVEKLRERLESLHRPHQLSVAAFHRAEQWRDRLIAGDNSALHEILQRHPGADTQRLRQLSRNAKKEAEQTKPPKSARELFRLIAETQQAGGETE